MATDDYEDIPKPPEDPYTGADLAGEADPYAPPPPLDLSPDSSLPTAEAAPVGESWAPTVGEVGGGILLPALGATAATAMTGGAALPTAALLALFGGVGSGVGRETGKFFDRGLDFIQGKESPPLDMAAEAKDMLNTTMINTAFDLAPMVGPSMKMAASKANPVRQALTNLGLPDSITSFAKGLEAEARKNWDVIRNSKILDGGSVYDTLSGTFEGGKKSVLGFVKKDAPTVIENVKNALTDVGKKLADAMPTLDQSLAMFRVATKNPNIGRIARTDIEKRLMPFEKALQDTAKTGEKAAEAGEMQALLNRLKDDVYDNYQSIPEIGFEHADTLLHTAYDELRELGKFDPKNMGGGIAATPSEIRDNALKTVVWSEYAKALRGARDDALKKVFSDNSQAGVALQSQLRKKGINEQSLTKLSDTYGGLKTLEKALDQSGFMLSRDQGRAMTGMTVDASGIPNVSQPMGMIEKGTTKFLSEPMGVGPSTLGFRAQEKQMSGIRGEAARQSGQMFSGADTARQIAAIGTGTALHNLVGDAGAQELYSKMATADTGQSSPGIPRKMSAILGNVSEIIDLVTKKTDEQTGQALSALLYSPMPARAKAEAFGKFLAALPEVNEIFQPSKSGAASEIDGRIQDEQDKAQAADEIDNSSMSIREKALAHTDLWRKGEYKKKGLYAQPQ